jgi:hypothetical protein
LTAVGSCLGIYVVLAIAYNWLIAPMVTDYATARAALPDTPVAYSAPSPAGSAGTPDGADTTLDATPKTKRSRPIMVSNSAATPEPVETSVAEAPKRRPKKQQSAGTTPRREHSGSGHGFLFDFMSHVFPRGR